MTRPHSRQILTVEETFGRNGWHCELIEGREVLGSQFEAHHGRISVIAQAFPELNGLSIVGEFSMTVVRSHLLAVLELLNRSNKALTLGGFEFDLDRQVLVFRLTNLFEKEWYDGDIVASLVHCAIAEMDRMIPYVDAILRMPESQLADLDIKQLLEREPVRSFYDEGEEGEEEEY